MSYAHEFAAAVTRSKEFGLLAPQFELETTRRWFDANRLARFPYVMRDGLGELGIEDLMSQCMSIHYRMRSVVQDWLDCPVMYTLGWIDDGTAHGMFKFDDAFITKMLRIGHNGGTVNLHAWLTLPSMEIIDVSLATTMGIAQKRPEMLGLTIIRPADELTGMAYKPMLVGDDFLRKTGLLIEW
ncbi:hypothetical protein [Paraburkholderia unamae]|nr:hypothetical protein [Paraburkholderia unamae]